MSIEKTFRTKTGYCHVLPDKILLTRGRIIGDAANISTGNSMSRYFVIYAALSFIIFYAAYDLYLKAQTGRAALFAAIGLYLAYGIASSLNNSAAPVIERKKIKSVTLKKAIPGLTRSRFEIKFENEQGKIKKRLVMLPGSLTGGREATEASIKIMTEEGLLATESR